jgi:hypothetical protein
MTLSLKTVLFEKYHFASISSCSSFCQVSYLFSSTLRFIHLTKADDQS